MKKNNLFKKIFNKNTILISMIATSIGLTPLILTLGLTYGTNKNKLTNSQKEIIDKYISEDNVWTINFDGQTKEFKNSVDLRNFIDQNIINETKHLVSGDINQYTNELGFIDGIKNKLVDDIFSRDELNKIAKNIYLGANDIAYDDVTKALNSFYQVKDGYYFNDIFFENKQDLKYYVLNEYLPSNPVKYNSIVLKGPNGVLSVPINLNDDKAILRIEQFIDNNAKKELVYRDFDNNSSFVIKGDGSSQIDWINPINMEYVHIKSNQGESRYIIDNHIDDSGNLIGPYFYNGVLDIPAFMDKTMWQKKDNINASIYFESVLDEQIGNFFKNILNDNKVDKSNEIIPELFNSNLVYETYIDKYTGKETIESLDTAYMSFLNQYAPRIYSEVIELNEIFANGKRANTFFKIPTLYSFILQRIVSYNAGQAILKRTIEYFTSICNLIDETLKVIVMGDINILKRSSDNKEFKTSEFFQIGNPEYDINTSTEYFLSEFKTWDRLVAAIVTYNSAVSNINIFAGWAPYDVFSKNVLFENKVISWKEYSINEQTYKAIYNVFSQLNYSGMINEIMKYDSAAKGKTFEQYTISLDNTYSDYFKLPYSYFIKKIGLTNTSIHDYNVSLIESEMAIFNESGHIIDDGYLIELYSPNPRYDRLSKFMSLMNKDEYKDAYQVYMGFVLESRSQNAFSYLDSKSEPIWEDVVHAVSRVFTTSIGATLTLNYALNSLVNGVSKRSTAARRNPINANPKRNPLKHYFTKLSNFRSRRASVSSARMISDQKFDKYNKIFSRWVEGELNDDEYVNLLRADDELKWLAPANLHVIERNNNTGTIQPLIPTSTTEPIVHNDNAIQQGNIRSKNEQRTNKNTKTNSIILELSDPNRSDEFDNLKLMWEKRGLIKYRGSHRNLSSSINLKSKSKIKSQINNNQFIELDNNENVNPTNPIPEKRAHLIIPTFEAQTARNGNQSFANPVVNSSGDDQIINNPSQPNSGSNSNGSTGSNGSNGIINPDNGNNTGSNNNGNGTNNVNLNDPVLGGNSSNKDPKRTQRFTKQINGCVVYNDPYPLSDENSSNKNLKSISKRPNQPKGNKKNKRKSSLSANSVSSASSRDSLIIKNTPQIFNKIGGVVSSLGASLMVVDVALLFVDFFRKEYKTDYYVFKTRDGTEFIWDGGESYSQYLGFQVTETKGIESMKMIKPVQVTLSQIQNYYYYEKIKFYDIKNLKLKQIWDMQNNPNSEIGFNFDNGWYLINDNDYITSHENIGDLTKDVISDLGINFDENKNPNFNNINKNSKYLSSANFSFSNIMISSKEHSSIAIANNIYENIRATKIVKMPYMENGYAINISNEKFEYPGKYWDRSKGKVVENLTRNSNDYLIDNSANLLKNKTFNNNNLFTDFDFVVENKDESERISSEKIRKSFDNKVSIMSKYVLSTNYTKTTQWSELSSDIDLKKIYSVRIPQIGVLYFADKQKALAYTYSVLGYTRKTNNYIFDNKLFKSKDQIYNYVYKNNLFKI